MYRAEKHLKVPNISDHKLASGHTKYGYSSKSTELSEVTKGEFYWL